MTRRHSIPDRLVQVSSTRSSATWSHLTTSKDGRSAYDKNNCINLRALRCLSKSLRVNVAEWESVIWRKNNDCLSGTNVLRFVGTAVEESFTRLAPNVSCDMRKDNQQRRNNFTLRTLRTALPF